MAQARKEKKVFNVKRVSVDKDSRVKFADGEFGLSNVNGAPAALADFRFRNSKSLAECRFESDAARDAAAQREWDLKHQQRLKAVANSDEVLQLVQDGKVDEAHAILQKAWDTYTYALGAATSGTAKVKVSRTELEGLKAQAAKMAEMEAELAALRAARGKSGK